MPGGGGASLVVVSRWRCDGAGGCTGHGDDPAGAVRPASGTAAAAAPRQPCSATAVTDLLRRRAAAVVAGDESAYAATVADGSSASGRRQLDAFGAARALRVSRLEVGEPVVDLVESVPGADAAPSATQVPARPTVGSTGPSAGTTGPSRATAQVDVRYRVDDLDRGDRVARLGVRPGAVTDAGWQVEAERPVGAGATAPWVAMPTLRVRRGEHAVVAGTVPTTRLAEHAAVVDRDVPTLRQQWPGTPSRVLVLAPSTSQEADALLGRRTESGAAPVAATTEGPLGKAGTATGDRVVLDPTAYGRLTASGRDVVLTHELAHVAVRSTVPGRPAAWLAEGYADHVGYGRADVSTARLVAPLVDGHAHRARPAPPADRVRPAADQRRHRGALPRGLAGRGADRARPRGGRPAQAGQRGRVDRLGRRCRGRHRRGTGVGARTPPGPS